ncbi:MAG: epoxyqueuosine reductase QueH [Ruminiclostridium sp.]
MNSNINYQKLLDMRLSELSEKGIVPTLLLHSCCAPCSSYVLEYLSEYFRITVHYYNPNITDKDEYEKRIKEQKRLIKELPAKYPVSFTEGEYCPDSFFKISKGLEAIPEGGERCFRCYRLRLSEAADYAKEKGFDFFTTTLSISPMKNAAKLNEIGGEEAERVGVPYLFSDFKKREGYKRSIVLSAEYGLYRQSYCGCIYSLQQAKKENRI